MPPQPSALLIDEDELGLVRAMIEDLEPDHVHLRGGKVELPIPYPSRLFAVPAALALRLDCRRQRTPGAKQAIWMAFV